MDPLVEAELQRQLLEVADQDHLSIHLDARVWLGRALPDQRSFSRHAQVMVVARSTWAV